MKAWRTLPLLTALSVPFLNSGCKKAEIEKPAIVKTVEDINSERKRLQKKESIFVGKVFIWMTYDTREILYGLKGMDNPKEKKEELIEIWEELELTNRNFLIAGIEREHSKGTVPSDKEKEAFLKLLDCIDRTVPLLEPYINMPVDVIVDKCKGHLTKNSQSVLRSSLEGYKEILQEVKERKKALIQSTEDFNRDAKKLNLNPYGAMWGLNLERLIALKL